MKHFLMTVPKNPPKTPTPSATAKPDAAFDVWLQRGLHKMFDDVASEPIPDELLRLIEEHRNK